MTEKSLTYLKVGPLVYKVTSSLKLALDESCSNFFHEEMPDSDDISLRLNCNIELSDHIFDTISQMKEEGLTEVFTDGGVVVYKNEDREWRLKMDYGGKPYTLYVEKSDDEIEIYVDPHCCDGDELTISTYFLESFALERYLIRCKGLILHSAFIDWKCWGIDFTAPSGTGKSTQASLWEKYEGVEVINGDRSIIIWNEKEQRFDVCGLPFCGSSGIHKDRRIPLLGITFIEQSPVNIVEEMPAASAMIHLTGEMSVNKWNREFVIQSLDVIDRLVSSVNMVHLKCNMEQDAVDTLKSYLQSRQKASDE